MNQNIGWGTWECPNCGDEHDDPETITETCCDCGQVVLLSGIDDEGRMDALPKRMIEPMKPQVS